jgi:hypothetical protein
MLNCTNVLTLSLPRGYPLHCFPLKTYTPSSDLGSLQGVVFLCVDNRVCEKHNTYHLHYARTQTHTHTVTFLERGGGRFLGNCGAHPPHHSVSLNSISAPHEEAKSFTQATLSIRRLQEAHTLNQLVVVMVTRVRAGHSPTPAVNMAECPLCERGCCFREMRHTGSEGFCCNVWQHCAD